MCYLRAVKHLMQELSEVRERSSLTWSNKQVLVNPTHVRSFKHVPDSVSSGPCMIVWLRSIHHWHVLGTCLAHAWPQCLCRGAAVRHARLTKASLITPLLIIPAQFLQVRIDSIASSVVHERGTWDCSAMVSPPWHSVQQHIRDSLGLGLCL